MLYSEQQLTSLLKIAKSAIEHHLSGENNFSIPSPNDPMLKEPGAVFITLTKSGQLRGCIGSLTPYRSLVSDVASNAVASAFSDPRFPPLNSDEIEQLTISISVLTPSIPIDFTDENDLISKIEPGIDGLILQDGNNRGTFLPSVWEQLPDVQVFWAHLKRKAGLPINHWSDTLKVSRYRTEYFKLPWNEI
jgi:AmmeMemoRadiSam system protein A